MKKGNWIIGNEFWYINRYYTGTWEIYHCRLTERDCMGHITFLTLTTNNPSIHFEINGDAEFGSTLFDNYEDAVKRLGDLEDYDNSMSKLYSENNRLKKYDESRDVLLHARLIEQTKDATLDLLLDMLTAKKYKRGDLKPFVLMEDVLACISELKSKMIIDPTTKKRS